MINRRNFLSILGTAAPGMMVMGGTMPSIFNDSEDTVNSVSLYLINVKKARNFSHSTWHNRQHIFIKIRSGEYSGWAEALANKNDLNFDIVKWGSFLGEIKGKSIEEAIAHSRRQFLSGKWNAKMSEPTLIALYDLMGKQQNRPTIELWGLDKREAVPGLFCILERDVQKALEQAKMASEQNLSSHVKVKMFGDVELDLSLARELRRYFGKDTFLMADANRGYKKWKDLDELAAYMKNLHAAGLDAMEDPAQLTSDQWIKLQSMVGEFSLIPDRPMRPAHKALDLFHKDMGHYFNIHPDTMGTFKEAVSLGKLIKTSDRGLMIGDSSLIGPACTFWQQLAIGVGASWIEAIEKSHESTVFQQCVKNMSTCLINGKTKITTLRPGFGVEMDEEKLKAMADKYVRLY